MFKVRHRIGAMINNMARTLKRSTRECLFLVKAQRCYRWRLTSV